MASAMEEPGDLKYGKEASGVTWMKSVGSESSGEAEHHEGVWTVCAAFRCDVRRFRRFKAEQGPEADRPGSLLFLRREESLEVTAGGHATPRGAQLF